MGMGIGRGLHHALRRGLAEACVSHKSKLNMAKTDMSALFLIYGTVILVLFMSSSQVEVVTLPKASVMEVTTPLSLSYTNVV